MYRISFQDTNLGFNSEEFRTFEEAIAYWNCYADTPTCIAGEMIDLDTNEIVWRFNVNE